MHEPLKDPVSDYPENRISLSSVEKTTEVIVLGYHSMFFGDLEAFSTGFRNIRNKVEIPHIDGSPQIGNMIKRLKIWRRTRELQFKIPPSSVAVLIPGEQWPVSVIIQMIGYLKESGIYENVILGRELR